MQQGPGNWQPTCGQASRQQTPAQCFVQQPVGGWYRAESRWMGQQPGWVPGSCSGVSMQRELATQNHVKGCLLFSLLPEGCSHSLIGKMKLSFFEEPLVVKGKSVSQSDKFS